MRNWYRFDVEAAAKDKAPTAADLYVFDQIGKSFWNDDAVTAAKFVADLKALPESVKTIRVHVNSPGGSVFDATAIANALRAEQTDNGRTVEVRIDGIAASAATIITSAGSPIRMADNAMLMIHDPSAIAMGSARDMRKLADTLDAVRDSIIAAYQWVSTKTKEELGNMMAETTWMNADQALANGFITDVVKGAKVQAIFTADALASLGDVPDEHKATIDALLAKPDPTPEPKPAPTAATAEEVLAECPSIEVARELIASGATLDHVKARVKADKAKAAAEASRQQQIRALCDTAGVADMADTYIVGGMTADAVRAQLAVLRPKFDAIETDGSLLPNATSKSRKSAIDTADIYRRFNNGAQK